MIVIGTLCQILQHSSRWAHGRIVPAAPLRGCAWPPHLWQSEMWTELGMSYLGGWLEEPGGIQAPPSQALRAHVEQSPCRFMLDMYCVCKTPRAVRQMVKPSLPQLVVWGRWRGAWAQGWGLCSSLSRRLRTKVRVRSRGATQTEEQESSRQEGQQGQKHPWQGRDSSVPLPPGWQDWVLAMMTPPDCVTEYFQGTHSKHSSTRAYYILLSLSTGVSCKGLRREGWQRSPKQGQGPSMWWIKEILCQGPRYILEKP